MKRKLISLILVVMVLCTTVIPVFADLEKDVRDSVVVVATVLDSDYGVLRFGSGTGFFINNQYLITNHHVVDTFLENSAGELDTFYYNDLVLTGRAVIRVYFDSNDYVEAYIVGYDERKDIAILRLDKATDKRVPMELMVPTEDMVGKSIYAIGYPGLADSGLAAATESWGKNGATVTSGTISRLLTQSGTGQQNVQIDCNIKHGNSGGPVVTSDGAVIGVATWSVISTDVTVDQSGGMHVENESVNYAVNIADAILLLNQYGVSYTMASETVPAVNTGDPSQPANTVIIDNPVQPKEDNTLLIVLIILVSVLIVAAVAIGILLLLKKNKQPVAPVVPVMPVTQPTIRSLSRINYGTVVHATAQPILIGRGGNCGLRFPDNAPGISGSHCSVQWDSATKDFIVTDLNSTYGTYLQSGQKMRPNQPYRMRAGDKFYLADQNNMIGLTME